MLKKKIAKLEDVEEQFRGLYKEQDGAFVLQIEGGEPDDSTTAAEVERLKKHMATLLEEKKAESEKRRQAEEEARQQADDAARKKGDVAALEASWKEKMDEAVSSEQSRNKALERQVQTLLIDNVAKDATAGFIMPGSEGLASELIKQRLAVEYDENGVPKTRVLDANGQPTALSIDDLKAELKANPSWAPLILASRASGSGAVGGSNGGGAAKKWADCSEKELVELSKNDPGEYARLRETR